MPVTAKLSRKFYERLGDEIANELVEWFNSVDTTYRTELREFNELNFARFDAKVEQRFAEADAKQERRLADFLAKIRAELDARFAASEAKFDARLAASEAKSDARFAAIDARFAKAEVQAVTTETRMLRWMFTFWMGSMLALAGFMMAVLSAVKA